MSSVKPVRWMVSFWHPDGGSRDETDFPQVDFWHPDRARAREEAARVLIELREQRNDTRDWVAAGHPDPREVGAGHHPGGQWILRYSDLKPPAPGERVDVGDRWRHFGSVAGAWKDNRAAEELQREIEARRTDEPVNPGP